MTFFRKGLANELSNGHIVGKGLERDILEKEDNHNSI
jgi:hypothetical protein